MFRSERFRRLLKEGFWVAFGQVLAVFGSLVGIRLLTELMPPHVYGELALGMTAATLINQVIYGPLGGGMARFYTSSVEHHDFGGYLRAIKKVMVYATGVVFIFGLIVVAIVSVIDQSQWISLVVSALLLSILSGCSASIAGIQTAARQRSIVALHLGMDPLLRALLATSFLLWLGATSAVAMTGYVFGLIILILSQVYFFRKTIKINLHISSGNIDWQRKIWEFSWPMSTFGVFSWLFLSSDRWSLQVFATPEDVGNFVVLYQLGFVPILILNAMTAQLLLPILYQRIGDASDGQRNLNVSNLNLKLAGCGLILTAVLVPIALLLHSPIYHLIVAKEFRSTSYLLPWMILAGGVFASGQALTMDFMAQIKTRKLIPVKLVTAIIGLILNIAGAYWYGMQGVVFAGVVFSVVYFIWMALLVLHERNGIVLQDRLV